MHEKGPPVYLDYDQAALDAAYDQAAYAPNREQLIKRRIRDSELARLRVGEPERLAYGPAEIERLDIYRAEREAAPICVFIHGGAWRSSRSKEFASPAEMFLVAGAHYVVPDFAWVQDVGGSLMVLADQVRRAIAWVYENAAHLGIDRNRFYIGGQSSGGHCADDGLVARLRLADGYHQGRHVHQRHVRSNAGAAVGSQCLRRV
jgi:arylformamidase